MHRVLALAAQIQQVISQPARSQASVTGLRSTERVTVDLEKIVQDVLATTTKLSGGKRVEAADAILAALDNAGALADGMYAVAVVGARIPVEYVPMYGLEIGIDANGNAVSIGSPWGLEVDEGAS